MITTVFPQSDHSYSVTFKYNCVKPFLFYYKVCVTTVTKLNSVTAAKHSHSVIAESVL